MLRYNMTKIEIEIKAIENKRTEKVVQRIIDEALRSFKINGICVLSYTKPKMR